MGSAAQPAHVVLKGDALFCRFCGATERVLPMPLSKKRIAAFQLIGEAFGEEHAGCKETDASPSRRATKSPAEWLRGGDTGISSETIWSVITGNPVRHTGWPLDPDDFGRCHRLLALFPAWRAQLEKVAAAFPRTPWAGYVAAWDRMAALYEEELPSGEAPKLYVLRKREDEWRTLAGYARHTDHCAEERANGQVRCGCGYAYIRAPKPDPTP